MNRSIHQFFPRTKTGNTIPGAEYTVKDATSGLDVAIFDSADSETPKTQPYKADGNGKVLFYIEPGIYNIDSTDLKTGNTGSKIDVPIGVSRRELSDNNGVKQFDKTYATVADMKADTSLQANGSKLIHTVDYYSTQRGGGASYLIKTTAQADADGDVYSATSKGNILLDNGNVAVIQESSALKYGATNSNISTDSVNELLDNNDKSFFDVSALIDDVCEISNGVHVEGESLNSGLVADPSFEALYTTPYNDGSGDATIPAPMLSRVQTAGQESRNPISKLFLNGNGSARTGLYLGIAADISVSDLQIKDTIDAGLAIDGIQNSSFDTVTVTGGTSARILNGTYNSSFSNLDMSEQSGGFLQVEADPTYPSYGFFGAGDNPRNLTFRDFIWERVEGDPFQLVRIDKGQQIKIESGEIVFTGSNGTTTNVTSIAQIIDSNRVKFDDMKFQGGGAQVFNNDVNVINFTGSLSQDNIVRNVFFLAFNESSSPIKSIINHTDGNLIVENIRYVSCNFQKLIRSSNPSIVTYLPWRRSGAWSVRPLEWIEANVEYFDVDSNLKVTKKPNIERQDPTTATALAGSTNIQVDINFRRSAIVGDIISLTLDDGVEFVSYITSVNTGPDSIDISDPTPSDAAAGNNVAIGGRWYRSNGLHWFGGRAYADGDQNPSVAGVESMIIENTSPLFINGFDDGQVGQLLTIIAEGANNTIANGANIVTKSGANIAMSDGDTAQFILRNDFKWAEV